MTKGWQQHTNPAMVCYKLVRVDFKYWGLQSKVENAIVSNQESLFHESHRKCFCLMDEWFGLTMDDIRVLEKHVKESCKVNDETDGAKEKK